MKHTIIVALVMFSAYTCKAESTNHEELVHFSAHFGMSYAINTIAYAGLNKIVGADETTSFIVANALTLAVGALYKISEAHNGRLPRGFAKSMAQNVIGVGFSNLTILTFNLGGK